MKPKHNSNEILYGFKSFDPPLDSSIGDFFRFDAWKIDAFGHPDFFGVKQIYIFWEMYWSPPEREWCEFAYTTTLLKVGHLYNPIKGAVMGEDLRWMIENQLKATSKQFLEIDKVDIEIGPRFDGFICADWRPFMQAHTSRWDIAKRESLAYNMYKSYGGPDDGFVYA
jgi:hypothetical protein